VKILLSTTAVIIKPKDRKATLDSRQHAKMASSAHAYVRGNTIQFYDWLQSKAVQGTVPAGPDIWICGDCHTGNLGPIADLEGNIDIQIRDLDQTVIGNPAHDILRLGLSLAMAARSSDLPGVTTALMIEEMIAGYITGLSGHYSKIDPKNLEPINRVMRAAKRRHWKHLAAERIEDVKPTIPLGSRFWALSKQERAQLTELVETGTVNALVQNIGDSKAADPQLGKKVHLLDAAYWMKGCSSLGRLRYALLVAVGDSKKKNFRLLDIKEAIAAAAPASEKGQMPSNNAERVVCGANALAPYLGERMVAAGIAGKQVFVRELRPQDMKFELENLSQPEAIAIARLMAGVVGRAHGRQLTAADRQAWIKDLKSRNKVGLDAPRWLWSSVLDLVALHESAYLDHCRRYALGQVSKQSRR
jgi:uncharacterized protein (DUF2252 family)